MLTASSDDILNRICRSVQDDIPLVNRPFREIADWTGTDEVEVIATIRDLQRTGKIRKFGAVLIHQAAGYRENAMVVWAAPREQCEEAGRILASFREVTHCYEREPAFEGKYTIFSMVHFRKDLDRDLLERMAAESGVADYKILRSLEEYKKTSMTYF